MLSAGLLAPSANAVNSTGGNGGGSGGKPAVIYNSTDPLPAGGTSFPSEGYECCEIAEFGDAVGFTGTNRLLTSVTITMDDWAFYTNPAHIPATFDGEPTIPGQAWKGQPTGDPTGPNGATYSNPKGFYQPVTLTLYNAVSDPTYKWATGSVIDTVNQTVLIPWQPTPSLTNACLTVDNEGFGNNVQAWSGGLNSTGSGQGCLFGYAANITLSIPSGVTVPNNAIWGLTYNTENYGPDPTGVNGPYDSLNVAVTPSVTTGTDINPGAAFLNGGTYPYSTSGPTGVFRNDCNLPDNCENWAGYVPAAEFTATSGPAT
jgi:hypothetical protein